MHTTQSLKRTLECICMTEQHHVYVSTYLTQFSATAVTLYISMSM